MTAVKKTIIGALFFFSPIIIIAGISCFGDAGKNKPVTEKTDTTATTNEEEIKAEKGPDSLPPYYSISNAWVDSVYNSLSDDEKIAQLFMVAAYSKNGTSPNDKIVQLVRDYKIGGLIFMQGGPGRQAILNNHYQSIAKTPLLISIDGEWGLSMRLDSTMKFPWQMTLGAVQNDQLIYEMGKEIARQCKRVGIHINFAPVVDVNNNRKNPVINARSFGEDKKNVSRKGIAYMKGMQDNGVMANAKHFPGHGDTDKDSHHSLPQINHSRTRLDTLELYPFRELIKNGLGSVMVAHLHIPALDNTPNMPTTLSSKVINGLLKKDMGFKGLVFTDALNMKGVSDLYPPGEVDVRALLAGNDILLFSGDVPTAIVKIKVAIKEGKISMEEINEKCKNILRAKYWCGLHKKQEVSLTNLDKDLWTKQGELVLRKLTEASLTVLKNDDQLIPLKKLDSLKIASVTLGAPSGNTFQGRLSDYAQVDHFQTTEENAAGLLSKLSSYNVVIVSIHKNNESPFKGYAISAAARSFVQKVNEKHTTILAVFANPYSLVGFTDAFACEGLIMSYQDSDLAQDYTAQLIFGGIQATGRLPVTVGDKFPAGYGLDTEKPIRMKYTIPEDVGIKSEKLDKIGQILEKAIADTLFPGCQVLAAKGGKIFYHKSFGFHTYEKDNPVQEGDLYDIASITKVSATLPCIMKLVDEKKIDLNATLGHYLPELKSTTKENIKLIDVLTHQAQFKSWLPFHNRTMYKDKSWKQELLSASASDQYPLQVADHMFISGHFPDTMFRENILTPLTGKTRYLYSDLGYYYLIRIIEKVSGQTLEAFLDDHFYSPLGATRLTFNPLKKFAPYQVVPTENDTVWRKQLVHGYVHDQGAALLGGVAGHAGLFASANDLAKLFQLYLDKGNYGGEQLVQAGTLEWFEKCQFCSTTGNRRGIGFDKPDAEGNSTGGCTCASRSSFGHAGFTGTLAWVDPEIDLVYIFLSNRIHPSAENKRMIKEGTRAKVQQVFYDAIKS